MQKKISLYKCTWAALAGSTEYKSPAATDKSSVFERQSPRW